MCSYMADIKAVHSKWHSLLECLQVLSETKESSPGALTEPLIEYWKVFDDYEALWTASEQEGLPALVSALKKALAVALRQPATSWPWLAEAPFTVLRLCRGMFNWQRAQTADWCTPNWRPLLDLLLAWAPRKIAGAWQDLQFSGVGGSLQNPETWLLPLMEVALDVLGLLLVSGAREWARPAALVQALEDWLVAVDLAAAESGDAGGAQLSDCIRMLAHYTLIEDKAHPWQADKTAALLAEKTQLLQRLLRHVFFHISCMDEDKGLGEPGEDATGKHLLENTLAPLVSSNLLACAPLQPALLGLLTTSRSVLEGLQHTHKLAGLWVLAACEELERALAGPGSLGVHDAALQLRNVATLLVKGGKLLCKVHGQQVQAGSPGTDEAQAALYQGCAAAFRALQVAARGVAAQDAAAQASVGAGEHADSTQDSAVLEPSCMWPCAAAYSALVVHLQGLSAARYGPGIGREAMVAPASARCLAGSTLLHTLRGASFVLGMHGSPLLARLLCDAWPALSHDLGWPGSCSAQDLEQHALATALRVVADHLEVLEGRPDRMAELGQELVGVTTQLVAAQGRLLTLDLQGWVQYQVTDEFELHWGVLLGLAKLVGRLQERGLVSQRVFQGLGYCCLHSLNDLLLIHSMRPAPSEVGWEGLRAVILGLRQLATSSVEVIASLQLQDLAAASLLREGFVPILIHGGNASLLIEAVHDAMAALLQAVPRITAGVVAGSGVLVEFAAWLKYILEALRAQGLGRHPKVSERFNAVQQQVGRLVRLCCQALAEAGDACFLLEELAIEAASKAHLQQLLAAPTAAGGADSCWRAPVGGCGSVSAGLAAAARRAAAPAPVHVAALCVALFPPARGSDTHAWG